MSKHTPGPWKRVANSIKSRKAQCIVVRLPAYDAVGDESDSQIERWDADARLIAAAPELLEALEAMLAAAQAENPLAYQPEIFSARAVIAKARGETE